MLNESVAAAVKDAVTLAVQEAIQGILAEVLSNPDLLAKLRGLVSQTTTTTSAPVTPAAPAADESRVGTLTGQVGSWLGRWLVVGPQACASVTGASRCVVRDEATLADAAPVSHSPAAGGARRRHRGGHRGVLRRPVHRRGDGLDRRLRYDAPAQAGIWLRRTFAALELPTTSPATAC